MACRPLHCTCLLPSKDVLVKVELELFIGNVDTELLKGVAAEVLEAKNVQNANVPQLNQPCYESQNAETLYHTAQQTCTLTSPSTTVITHSPINRRVESRVDPVHNPAEQSAVQCLGHGITDIHRLFHSV